MYYDLLNNSDREILTWYRLSRFRNSLVEICGVEYSDTPLYLSLDNSLIISCEGIRAQKLILNRFRLKNSSDQILGATNLIIYQDSQLIYSYNRIIDYNDVIETSMTYTVERELERDLRPDATPKITKSLALTDIAADLDASPEDIHSFLVERDGTLIDFKGMIIVPESTAAIAYEHYSLVRARQKMLERFTNLDSSIKDTPDIRSSKPKSKKPTLTFKREFKIHGRNYKRTIENFQNAMFPDAPEQQKQAIFDIVAQNETGGAYLDKILRAGDYPDKRHARDLLYKAAAELSKKDVIGRASRRDNDGESERDPKEETESTVEQLQD